MIKIVSIMISLIVLLSAAEPDDLLLYQMHCCQKAIRDLEQTFNYPHGKKWLNELDNLVQLHNQGNDVSEDFYSLKHKALLSNPLLDVDILLVKRDISAFYDFLQHTEKFPNINQRYRKAIPKLKDVGFPSNHECNSSLKKTGWKNEIAVLRDGELTTLYRPQHFGYVGELDVHWNADKLLFTQSDSVSWKVFEMKIDGSGLRQVSQTPNDIDCADACYAPNDRIIFGSTAGLQSVPCWHGRRLVSNLFSMQTDGSRMRRLCFDQDHDFHPVMLPNGQVLYNRWDYTGISHIYLRQLMVMFPDGTGQRAIYGSNSWFPNSLYFARPLPASSSRLIAILSGYHGTYRFGQLVIVNTQAGHKDGDGLTRISGRGQQIDYKIKDELVDDDWPKFIHPFPLSEKYFLVTCWPSPTAKMGLYLADAFDNLTLIKELENQALFEPIPVQKQTLPIVRPDRIDPSSTEAIVYLHDVYAGPGLQGIPRGVVKKLRVLAYDFGYPGLAGPHKIGYGGPWEAMSILGTVDLEEDGSAMFMVPANTPIAFQAVDAENRAVQLMRSWTTAMPGEKMSCIGCHESPAEVAPVKPVIAAQKQPKQLKPWYGPPRGFDFAREVQPVLDKYCTTCHNGRKGRPDLRREELVPAYKGTLISTLGRERMHPQMDSVMQGKVKYTPAYVALIPYIRRVSIEDDVSLLVPGELSVETSPLVQMLMQGHHGVSLDAESWDRLFTWIDLNAPCHGTWNDVFPVPDCLDERRAALAEKYGKSCVDLHDQTAHPVELGRQPHPLSGQFKVNFPNAKVQVKKKKIVFPDNSFITFVKIPGKDVWMTDKEISNQQFRLYAPLHDSGYYNKRHLHRDDQGILLNQPDQPVVRVSLQQAQDFCKWLSEQTDYKFRIPTKVELEAALHFTANFESQVELYSNTADTSFSHGFQKDGLQITGGVEHLALDGADLARTDIDDGCIVTAPVGSFQPNALGMYDLIGNAAEWTSTIDEFGRAVVLGGSFYDPVQRCLQPLTYPTWMRPFNSGFRIVMENSQ